MKKLIAAALAISMMLLCCACGKKADDSDLSYIQKKGTLVVGITDYEPMDYQDENGEWIGFDADTGKQMMLAGACLWVGDRRLGGCLLKSHQNKIIPNQHRTFDKHPILCQKGQHFGLGQKWERLF